MISSAYASPAARPDKVNGTTYKIRWPQDNFAYYITINDIEEDGVKRPFEVFINSKSVQHQEYLTALTRLLSSTTTFSKIQYLAELNDLTFRTKPALRLGSNIDKRLHAYSYQDYSHCE